MWEMFCHYLHTSLDTGRISLAYDREKIYTIPADMEVTMDYLFGKLTELAKKVDTFALCI